METRLDCLGGDAETGRRLLGAHLLDGAQHEDAAEIGRQLVYRFLDGAADLPPGDRLLGGWLCRGEGPGIGREGFRHLADIDGRTPPPQPRERFIGDDPRQPGREARSAPEPVKMSKRVHIAVVNRLFGLHIISEKTTSQPVQPLVYCCASKRQRRPNSLPACRRAARHRRRLLALARTLRRPSTPPASVKLLDALAGEGVPAVVFFYRCDP